VSRQAVCLFRPVSLPAGSPLYLEGFPAHSIFALRSGTCKTLHSSRSGKEQILRAHRPGDLIGLDALTIDTYVNTAQATTSVVVCHAPRHIFTELATHEPAFAHEVIRFLCDELQEARAELTSLGTLGATARVSRMLLRELRAQHSELLHLPLNRRDTATLLGMAEESLSRQITHLEQLGVLRRQGHGLRITDERRLGELAAS
jgi:CRP/FNR family transcriptional regulator